MNEATRVWDDYRKMLDSVEGEFQRLLKKEGGKIAKNSLEMHLYRERWDGLDVRLYWKTFDGVQRNIQAEIDYESFLRNLPELQVRVWAYKRIENGEAGGAWVGQESIATFPLPLAPCDIVKLRGALARGYSKITNLQEHDLADYQY